MKKNNFLFIMWVLIVAVLIALLTFLGFMLKGRNEDYVALENKLLSSAKKYVDTNFLYPKAGEITKVSSQELIENEFLDNLKFDDDTCEGYVNVSFKGVYKYKAYIKCSNYKTNGYKK